MTYPDAFSIICWFPRKDKAAGKRVCVVHHVRLEHGPTQVQKWPEYNRLRIPVCTYVQYTCGRKHAQPSTKKTGRVNFGSCPPAHLTQHFSSCPPGQTYFFADLNRMCFRSREKSVLVYVEHRLLRSPVRTVLKVIFAAVGYPENSKFVDITDALRPAVWKHRKLLEISLLGGDYKLQIPSRFPALIHSSATSNVKIACCARYRVPFVPLLWPRRPSTRRVLSV